MAISANVIAWGAVAAMGMISLVAGPPAGWADQPAAATQSTSAHPTPVAEPTLAASAIASGGVTLHSVTVNLTVSERTFPGGAEALAINRNCLICHSAGMVLTQPRLSRADWQAEVNKMRNLYKAPIPPKDVPAIVDYLSNLGNMAAETARPRR